MASHTGTSEWQSFELRMRRRRGERLLSRAEQAIDAGHPEDARACLAEARNLAPGLPAIDTIQRRLDSPAADSPELPPPASPLPADDIPLHTSSTFTRTRAAGAVAAAAILAILAIAAWPRANGTEARALYTASDFRGVVRVIDAPAVFSEKLKPVTVVERDADSDRAVPELPPNREDEDTTSVSAAPALVPPRVASSVATPETIDPPTVPATGMPGTPTTVSSPAPAPPPADTAVAPDAAVRRTLERYAAAYSDLDAAAAARVWPTVNRDALARAFDALASQRVSLGECRIDVNGADAHAQCAGSATWAARIGGGSPRTEAREWTFDLARAGDDWRIVSARAQNR